MNNNSTLNLLLVIIFIMGLSLTYNLFKMNDSLKNELKENYRLIEGASYNEPAVSRGVSYSANLTPDDKDSESSVFPVKERDRTPARDTVSLARTGKESFYSSKPGQSYDLTQGNRKALEGIFEEKEKEKIKLKAAILDLSRTKEALEAEVLKLKKEKDDYARENEKLQGKLKTLYEDLRANDDKFKSFREENQRQVNDAVLNLERELADYKLNLNKIMVIYEKLKSELDTAVAELARKEGVLMDKDKKIAMLAYEADSLKAQLIRYEDYFNQAKQTQVLFQEKLAQLQDLNRQLESKLAYSSLTSSLPSPYGLEQDSYSGGDFTLRRDRLQDNISLQELDPTEKLKADELKKRVEVILHSAK